MGMITWLTLCQLTGFIAARELVGYHERTFRLRLLPNLTYCILTLCWVVSVFVILTSQWYANSTNDLAVLVPVVLLFPIFNAIDVESRLVPTVLINIGSIYCATIIFACTGLSGLVRSVTCVATYLIPMLIVTKIRPGSIGGGDIRLGLLVGLIVGVNGSPFTILNLLIMTNMLAVCVFFLCKVKNRNQRLSIPLVPSLTVATILVSLKII